MRVLFRGTVLFLFGFAVHIKRMNVIGIGVGELNNLNVKYIQQDIAKLEQGLPCM